MGRKIFSCDDITINGSWIKYLTRDGKAFRTFSCTRWENMVERCREGGAYQKSRPTYMGCTLSEDFKNFQMFADWHVAQIGYKLLNYHIDKDLLFSGNRIYSSATCVLIPRELNYFILDSRGCRGQHPQGVYWCERDKRFTARVGINGKAKHIGNFLSSTDAFIAYKEAKEAEAYRWYVRLKSGEFAVDDKVIERMRTWTLN